MPRAVTWVMKPRNSEPQLTAPAWLTVVVAVVVVPVVGVDVDAALEVIDELGVTEDVDTTVVVTVFDEPQPPKTSAAMMSARTGRRSTIPGYPLSGAMQSPVLALATGIRTRRETAKPRRCTTCTDI